MVRFFITRDYFGTLLMALYAKMTYQEGYNDVLIIQEMAQQKKTDYLIGLIKKTKEFHRWSSIEEYYSKKKNIYVIKNRIKKVMIFLRIFNFYLRMKKDRKIKLINGLNFDQYNTSQVEINTLIHGLVCITLLEKYKHAKLNYFEMGIGHYLNFYNKNPKLFNFYSLFFEQYQSFLNRASINSDFVKGYFELIQFENLSRFMLGNNMEFLGQLNPEREGAKSCILILLQNLEVFNAPNAIWDRFIDECLRKVDNPQRFHFIIKPHYMQSYKTVQYFKKVLQKNNVSYTIWNDKHIMQLNIETFFWAIKDKVKYVFSLFSTSIFTLSYMYKNSNINFFYSYDFIADYLVKAPVDIRERYMSFESIIKECLAKNCETL